MSTLRTDTHEKGKDVQYSDNPCLKAVSTETTTQEGKMDEADIQEFKSGRTLDDLQIKLEQITLGLTESKIKEQFVKKRL